MLGPGRAFLSGGDLLGKGDFQDGEAMEEGGAMKVQEGGLLAFDAPVLTQIEREVAADGGFELVGLQPGDERLIRLAPREAFGDWDVNAVLMMRESRLVEGKPLEDGTTLQVETEDGASALCRAYRVSEDRLALDFNHPLAGQALTIFVRVNEVNLPVERGQPSSRCPDAERHGGGRSPRRRGASSEEAVPWPDSDGAS